jgi:hypothetical protein
MPAPLPIRIFLASPGDVADERALAFSVLEQLQYDLLLRGKIAVEAVAWDKLGTDTPMLVTLTPQEAIKRGLPKPSGCDIMVVIFWSRMGMPLPANWAKPDGSPYLSGTEWEYFDAVGAARESDKPAVLVYRRTERVSLYPDDPEFAQKHRQWQLVETFFESLRNPDGSIRGGVNAYTTPSEFREKLGGHLRDLIARLLKAAEPDELVSSAEPTPPPSEPPLWQGSPFPGLRAFTPDDAPIFFGRERETDELIDRLGQGNPYHCRGGGLGFGQIVAGGRGSAGATGGQRRARQSRLASGALYAGRVR